MNSIEFSRATGKIVSLIDDYEVREDFRKAAQAAIAKGSTKIRKPYADWISAGEPPKQFQRNQ
jgi:hypothetical protein